jgi:hypothetical protein
MTAHHLESTPRKSLANSTIIENNNKITKPTVSLSILR